MIPTNVVFFLCFAWLKRQRAQFTSESLAGSEYSSSAGDILAELNEEDRVDPHKRDALLNKPLTWRNFCIIWPYCGWLSMSLGAVKISQKGI